LQELTAVLDASPCQRGAECYRMAQDLDYNMHYNNTMQLPVEMVLKNKGESKLSKFMLN